MSSPDNQTLPSYVVEASEITLVRYYNNKSVFSRVPLIFLLLLMIMVGFTVNSCILFVFLKRFPASAIRTYMVTLAFCDFVACACGMPLEVYVTINAYLITGEWLCKLHYVVTSWSTTTSSFTVIAIAIDRLRRVKEPTFKDDDKYRSYWVVAVVVITASALTLPFVTLAGLTERKLPFKPWETSQTLHVCWMQDRYDKDKTLTLPSVYRVVLTLTFMGGTSLICGCYGLITYNIDELFRNISDKVNDALNHPVRKYRLKLPDTPHEAALARLPDPSVMMSRKKTPLGVRQPENLLRADAGLTFAEKMHAKGGRERPSPTASVLAPQVQVGTMKKISNALSIKSNKIKKISDAVVNFFVEPEKKSSTSRGTTYVSKRVDSSFIFSPSTKSPSLNRSVARMIQGDARSGREVPLSQGGVPLVKELTNNVIGTSEKPAVSPSLQSIATSLHQTSLSALELAVNLNQSAIQKQGQEAPNAAVKPSVELTNSEFDVDLGQKALRNDQQALAKESKESVIPAEKTESKPTNAPLTAGEASLEREDRFSGQSSMEIELLETLANLEEIKQNASSGMLTLIILYIVNWLPNLLARLVTTDPIYLCSPEDSCWSNLPSFGICSVYISSTVNAFFYCFRSVHFRKQVHIVFKQVQERLAARYRARTKLAPRSKPPEIKVDTQAAQPLQEGGALQSPPCGPPATLNNPKRQESSHV